MAIMAIGEAKIITGMPFEEYRAAPGMNQSSLVAGRKSMLHAKHKREESSNLDTPSTFFGRFFHSFALRPGDVWSEYYVAGNKPDGRTTAGKTFLADAITQADGKELIWMDDMGRANSMLRSLSKLENFAVVESMPSRVLREAAFFWTEPRIMGGGGLKMKSLLDLLVYPGQETPTWILDLKTTTDASPEGFARSFWKWKYDFQAGVYCSAAESAFGHWPRYTILAVESVEPFAAAAYDIPATMTKKSSGEFNMLADQYREEVELKKDGIAPGYPVGTQPLHLEEWRKKQWET